MLKGVMRVDDAKRAVDTGVSAISVSNHGGNNVDGTPASVHALCRASRPPWRGDRRPHGRRGAAAAATSSRRSRSGRGR